MDVESLIRQLQQACGEGAVANDTQTLYSYSCDMYPRNQILKQARKAPPVEPTAVCFPRTIESLRAVLAIAREHRVPVIPYAAGSGVCGATIPEHGGIMVDMKRFDGIIEARAEERVVVVERLEDFLNQQGYTLGHFPSSFRCSTVGGWIACRSAGQFSSRYGKIEDLTVGLEMLTPTGEELKLGICGGGHPRDPMLQLMLGSEGTLGFITRAALRTSPLPATTHFGGLAFMDLNDGTECMRRLMQAGIRPTVLRLYDPLDSLIAGTHLRTGDGEELGLFASRLTGLKALWASAVLELNQKAMIAALLSPQWVNRVAEVLPARPLLIYGLAGTPAVVAQHQEIIADIVRDLHGDDLGEEPGRTWLKRRYAVSYKQAKIFRSGAFVDTMEVATTWDNLMPLYRAVLDTMGKHVFIMAHFSHAYPHGCSIYFTFAGYSPTHRGSLNLYRKTWQAGMGQVLSHGGTLTHHHGVGILKRGFLHQECPGGRELFRAAKAALDPARIMNPGKLYGVD